MNLRSATFMLTVLSAAAAFPRDDFPRHGAASLQTGKSWEWGFVSGNGHQGGLIFGEPGKETLIATHIRLWLPLGTREIVPDIGKYLPEVRRVIQERGYDAGDRLMQEKARSQGWPGLAWTDPFHPAFFLHLNLPSHGPVKDYVRAENFQTGEVTTRWDDAAGSWQHRMFVSRTAGVMAWSISAGRGAKLTGSISLDKNTHASIRPEILSASGWITGHMTYVMGKGGYDYVIRAIHRGGTLTTGDARFTFEDANEVLLLALVVPWRTPLADSEAWNYSPQNPIYSGFDTRAQGFLAGKMYDPAWLKQIVRDVSVLQPDYVLVQRAHATAHGQLFNRVVLDLGGAADRNTPIEELFARADKTKEVPPALMEKIYEAGRYMLLCCSGEAMPNLYGIWTGVWSPAWSGDYTTDANLECAIAAGLSGNTPELMEGYFRTVESWLPDMRLNAQRIYGCRGLLANSRASNNCLMLHWGGGWTGQMWLSGAGWMSHWYYDYYLYTGNREFLARRAVPILKDVALFYEDFLKDSVDPQGRYLFRPSFSPECMLDDNATMDIAVAREVLTNLIAAAEELKVEGDNIPKWQTMLKKMPPYLVNSKGELQEASSPRQPRVPYGHRHHSLLYPVFQSHEFTPKQTPDLWAAAGESLKKKLAEDCEGSSFGRIQSGLAAAQMGMGDGAYGQIRKMVLEGKWYTSLMTSHDPNHAIFCSDANGGVPEIVNSMLVFSLPGRLDLLPAVPKAWPRGTLRGLLARGQITIDRLTWDNVAKSLHAELTSKIEQEVTLRLPMVATIRTFRASGALPTIQEKELTDGTRRIRLPAVRKVVLEVTY
jgi:alpha-L-fucosidase 2